MPNGVFHSCNDNISQEEMTGYATNIALFSRNALQYSSHPELDFLLLHF